MTNKEVRQYVHYAITTFGLVTPFVVSNCAVLRLYFLFILVNLLHWITNGNECCLSKMDFDGDTGAYTKNIYSKVGLELTTIQSNILNYGIMIGLLTYTYFKIKRSCGFTL